MAGGAQKDPQGGELVEGLTPDRLVALAGSMLAQGVARFSFAGASVEFAPQAVEREAQRELMARQAAKEARKLESTAVAANAEQARRDAVAVSNARALGSV